MSMPSLQHGRRQGKCESMVIHSDVREHQPVEATMAGYDSMCNSGPTGVSDPARRIIKMGGKMIMMIKGQGQDQTNSCSRYVQWLKKLSVCFHIFDKS